MPLDMTKFSVAPAIQVPGPMPSQQSALVSPGQASLNVESTPPGADIEIDGAFVGNTPSTIIVQSGSHQITVKKKGFAVWDRTFNITGGSIHLNAELEQQQVK